jgi:hypothetical protein
MSSANLFSYMYSDLEVGIDNNIWTFDYEDAYENVPVPHLWLSYQCFIWLGRFIRELKQIFGPITMLQNFDIRNSVKSNSLATCKIPSRWVHRQLDGTSMIQPRTLRPHTLCPYTIDPVRYTPTFLHLRTFHPWKSWGVQNGRSQFITSLYVSSPKEKDAFSNYCYQICFKENISNT